MASGTVLGTENGFGTVTDSMTVNTGTASLNSCVKTNGVVNVAGQVAGDFVGAAVTYFTVPAGFRPTVAVTVAARQYVTSSGQNVLVPATINPDGTVVSGYSASTHTSVFFFSACYHV